MNVGERLAEVLMKNGIDRIFGLPGGQTLPLYQGIFGLKGKIEHILMRDERSAGFAADAYARLTRKVGVCDATVGPGATNLVSPVAEAYCSSIPILAILSDIPRAWDYRRTRGNASQAIQQLDIFKPISKWQASITDPSAIDSILETALRIATTGRPGPVVISMPDDVGPMAIDSPPYQPRQSGAFFPRYRPAPDPQAIDHAIDSLSHSRKTLLVAGGGIHSAGADEEFNRFVRQLQVPVVTTISGKGLIAENDPLAFGVVGTFGNPVANKLLHEASLIFYIGCKIGQLTTLRFQFPPPATRILHLDSDPEEIGRNYPDTIPLLADAKLGLTALSNRLVSGTLSHDWHLADHRANFQDWYQRQTDPSQTAKNGLRPQTVMHEINRILTTKDIVVCDASLASGWASAYLKLQTAGHRFLAPRGLATLGWGAPAAIAAALATNRQQRILHIAGDGGFCYSIQELETMVRLNLPIVTLILNNSTLAWIKHIQRDRYQGNYLSTDFSQVDFATVAKGFGATGIHVTSLAELQKALAGLKAPKAPVVIDIISDPWESPVLTET